MNFSFIHITDHHLGESETDFPYGYPAAATFRLVMRHIAENVSDRADFIVTTGDIVNTPSNEAYQFLNRMLNIKKSASAPGPHAVTMEGLQNYPMYFVPGNHDERAAFIHNVFPGNPPMKLMNLSFDHKGIRFICVDWGGEDKAVVHLETLEFLSALEPGQPAVLLMHHNVAVLGTHWLDHFIADDIDMFTDQIKGKNILGIFCGHLHTTYERDLNGIPVFGLRSTAFQFKFDGKPVLTLQPPHYRVVSIQNGTLSTKIVEVPLPDDLIKLAKDL